MSDANNFNHIALLHPGQPGEGMGYNPDKPKPYPLDVADDLTCGNVPWDGCAMTGQDGYRPRLLGFQDNPEMMRVDLYAEDWRQDPTSAVGKFPVLTPPEGGISCLSLPVVEVEDFGQPAPVEEPEATAPELASNEEPVYCISVSYTGVRFAKPGAELDEGECEVEPGRVDPLVRDEGRAWLAQQS